MKSKELTQIAMFTMLIAASALIKIPIPVVPFTLQYLFTMLAGIFLGGKNGAISVALYTALGLIGLPIFAEGGGLWYLLKPSFGYILGFCVSTYVIGTRTEKGKPVLMSNFLGLMIVYLIGMTYYYIISNFVLQISIGLWPLFLYCFLLAVPGDICLCFVAAFLSKRVRPLIER
ncbi:biotin transport system substrate-specific component [Clostridiales Family XIII bacterium PM5-7]